MNLGAACGGVFPRPRFLLFGPLGLLDGNLGSLLERLNLPCLQAHLQFGGHVTDVEDLAPDIFLFCLLGDSDCVFGDIILPDLVLRLCDRVLRLDELDLRLLDLLLWRDTLDLRLLDLVLRLDLRLLDDLALRLDELGLRLLDLVLRLDELDLRLLDLVLRLDELDLRLLDLVLRLEELDLRLDLVLLLKLGLLFRDCVCFFFALLFLDVLFSSEVSEGFPSALSRSPLPWHLHSCCGLVFADLVFPFFDASFSGMLSFLVVFI